MQFNVAKCKVLHIGKNNLNSSYNLLNKTGETVKLENTLFEKDLGVTIDSSLKFSNHIANQVNKANRILGLIRRTYQFFDVPSFRPLFTSLVRPTSIIVHPSGHLGIYKKND